MYVVTLISLFMGKPSSYTAAYWLLDLSILLKRFPIDGRTAE